MSVQTKEHIVSLMEEHQIEISSFGVKRLGLFGSFIRNEQNDGSDVDVVVEFESGQKTFDTFMNLAFYLEDLFGRRVELVTSESLSPHIKPHILNEIEYVTFGPSISSPHRQRNTIPDGASGESE